MRAVIYARYSSENQNDRSIEDQVRLCRDYAERLGASVIEVYADHAISGSHAANRPALNSLRDAAARNEFDVVVSEALDRISRNQGDIAHIHEELRFNGVEINTVSEQAVSEIHIGLKGTMNALFSKELAKKVKRGQVGQAHAGKSPGGLAYGYDVVREYDDKGMPIRGGRAVNEEQAEVVREIFTRYARNESARAIAADLNRRGIPSPTGKQWNASTINGNRARGSGILWNEAYRGRIVYDRVSMVTNPATGKRVSRPNPRTGWTVIEAPHLRIVPDELARQVEDRKRRNSNYPVHQQRRPKHLLSGLVSCGACGAAYTIKSKDRMACTANREGRSCTNTHTIRRDVLEERVIGGLRDRLSHPDAIRRFATQYRKAVQADRKQRRKAERRHEKRLAELDRSIERVVQSIMDGAGSVALTAKLTELEAEKKALKDEFDTLDPPVVELHPNAANIFREKIADLHRALSRDGMRETAKEALRMLVDRIEIHPGEKRGHVGIEIFGELTDILNFANEGGTPTPRRTVKVVAGEGLHHNSPFSKRLGRV